MSYFEKIKDKDYVFAAFMLIANKMETQLERTLSKYDITAKQWFTLLVIVNAFETSPSIKDIAGEMSTSHQNIKQLTLKLEAKGLVMLEKDKRDQRVTKVIVTEKSHELFMIIEKDGFEFMSKFYKGIENDELRTGREVMEKIMENLNIMEERLN